MEEPLVSIIIPNYNKGNLIYNCINSALSQEYQNFEIIFIDNNSNDNSINILNQFNDKRINLVRFNNQGIIAASRNAGINLWKNID